MRPRGAQAELLQGEVPWGDAALEESVLGGTQLGPQCGSVCVAEVQSRYVRAPRNSADK